MADRDCLVQKEESTRRFAVGQLPYHPRYVVWELTLKCDQRCFHCGSRAGDARPEEITLEKALHVVEQLKELGTRDVVLIGGEAYLFKGFLEIIRALAGAGITVSMVTGGRDVSYPMARGMKESGLSLASVSIDGLESSHDLIRGNRGSYQRALQSLDRIREAGITPASNININRVNRDDLEDLFEILRARGIRSWQVQITTPLGRAADRPDMMLQPYDLINLLPRIAALKSKCFDAGITLMPGNNLGYFGPEETALRSLTKEGVDHFMGCNAGKYLMGIESDGSVKGCPSLQTDSYVGGNLKTESIAEIWTSSKELATFRNRSVDDLWGYCKECIFAETCKGGCSFTAHALFGRPGNNPYCHFRARMFARAGKRERLVLKSSAPGKPFYNGLYDIIVEEFDKHEISQESKQKSGVDGRRKLMKPQVSF